MNKKNNFFLLIGFYRSNFIQQNERKKNIFLVIQSDTESNEHKPVHFQLYFDDGALLLISSLKCFYLTHRDFIIMNIKIFSQISVISILL